MSKTVLFLVGPTGSGKSKLALALAKKLNGEIISCDSMQVYRGMDIGTDKPSQEDRKKILHHVVDLISPRTEYSVFKYRTFALKAIKQILTKGRLPIVVGGSGLYCRAITSGLASQPGRKREIRNHLENATKAKGVAYLHFKLTRADPVRARLLHPNDKRRIIRALEILQLSGRSQSKWERETKGLDSKCLKPIMFGLSRDRKELYERIEKRVDKMFDRGWINEVKRLKRRGLSQTARAAIGYGEIIEFLEGRRPFFEAKVEIKKRTRHLAKKQMTWFRNKEKYIHWIPVKGERFVSNALRNICSELTKRGYEKHVA